MNCSYITTREAAEKFGIKPTTVIHMAKGGRIPGAVKFGRDWGIPESWVYERTYAAVPVTHCHRGHLYDEENTYYRSDGRRMCKTCGRENKRRNAEKKKG